MSPEEATAKIKQYLSKKVKADKVELLEWLEQAFPKRSIIDRLDMVFRLDELRVSKKKLADKWKAIDQIGNPLPEDTYYG